MLDRVNVIHERGFEDKESLRRSQARQTKELTVPFNANIWEIHQTEIGNTSVKRRRRRLTAGALVTNHLSSTSHTDDTEGYFSTK